MNRRMPNGTSVVWEVRTGNGPHLPDTYALESVLDRLVYHTRHVTLELAPRRTGMRRFLRELSAGVLLFYWQPRRRGHRRRRSSMAV
jgi:hypothetical protein